MNEEKSVVAKQPGKPKQATARKDDTHISEENLSKLMDSFSQMQAEFHAIAEDLELAIHVNRILIELIGGISPGRKNLGDIELVKLRNEGVKIKDLARMQGVSECSMNRKLKELREAGVLKDVI